MSKRLTNEEFIEKARKKHGDKYDYSLVEYVNSRTNVKVICPKHGVFEITPNSHLRSSGGSGCIKCTIENQKYDIDNLIKKFNKIHNNKYDYSLVVYKNMKIKIKIICLEHGVFEQTPTNHIRGNGCPLCSYKEKIIDQDKIINRFDKKHKKEYDYSLVEYTGTDNKVKIICSKHGIFEQTPHAHLQGQGCPICSGVKKNTKENFIKKSNDVHGNKYDYSLVVYKNNKTKVKIICKNHSVFEQTPCAHLQGQGCPICSIDNRTHDVENVIKKFINIHGNKYDYSLIKYKNTYTKVKIICKKHGVFEQTPHAHLKGQGCPVCNESKGEQEISKILEKNNIKYIREYRFSDCRDKLPLPFDFYLPYYNLCIEYDGVQHFYENNCWNDLEYVRNHDNIKNNYCEEKNIRLLRIKFNNKNIKKTILNYIVISLKNLI